MSLYYIACNIYLNKHLIHAAFETKVLLTSQKETKATKSIIFHNIHYLYV